MVIQKNEDKEKWTVVSRRHKTSTGPKAEAIYPLRSTYQLAQLPRRFGGSETWCWREVFARPGIGVVGVSDAASVPLALSCG